MLCFIVFAFVTAEIRLFRRYKYISTRFVIDIVRCRFINVRIVSAGNGIATPNRLLSSCWRYIFLYRIYIVRVRCKFHKGDAEGKHRPWGINLITRGGDTSFNTFLFGHAYLYFVIFFSISKSFLECPRA